MPVEEDGFAEPCIDLPHPLGWGDSLTQWVGAEDKETKQRERMAAWLYLIRKHWQTLGTRTALAMAWRQYRMYAGSLLLLREHGWRVVGARHQEFLRAWQEKLGNSAGSPP